MRKERLLSATFEQSKKVVSKKILTEEGAQVGVLSSMKLSQRFSGLVILLLFIMSYGVGVYLPESLLTSTEKIRYISTSTAQSIVTIGTIFRIPLLALMYCSIVMVIINVFPKKIMHINCFMEPLLFLFF
ncbi:TPA: hypothetical protein ACGORS_002266 [Streptococcus suis]